MTQFIQENIVTIIIGLVTIGVTWFIYNKSRQEKRLTIELLSNALLLSVSKDIASDLAISYKGQSVSENLSSILLRVSNSGNLPITEADYATSLSFRVADTAKILSADTSDTAPRNLMPRIEIDKPNRAFIRPMLLNPGDSFVIRLVVLNNNGSVIPDARIQGVSSIGISAAGTPSSPTVKVFQRMFNASTIGWWMIIVILSGCTYLFYSSAVATTITGSVYIDDNDDGKRQVQETVLLKDYVINIAKPDGSQYKIVQQRTSDVQFTVDVEPGTYVLTAQIYDVIGRPVSVTLEPSQKLTVYLPLPPD